MDHSQPPQPKSPPPNPPSTTSIDTLSSSIHQLISNWHRTQQWQQLINLRPPPLPKTTPWRARLANLLESIPVHLVVLSLLFLDLAFTVLDLSTSLTSCKPSKHHSMYHWGSIIILSLLSTKTLASLVAMGTTFFKSVGRVVDGVVVIGALLLEAFVADDGKGAGLLVVVSLWRVVRVIESAFELSNESVEKRIEEILARFEMLRGESQRNVEEMTSIV
ncbi:hypothetical protein QJS10_CPB04g01394 [Acorus calamus]|uniref:Voltage-gated hydrogen channel 1 n=1 Tax=Acorus calamus TaxID=4465 RepID=A0AAV9F0B4_ACOCL|nr:hypothetical protein QJS10_CPB04g01394 [Acorus calamus]